LNYREACHRCRKAKVTCICGRIRPFASDPRLAILIHPREARNRVGTGRMLHLSVTNSVLINDKDFSHNEQVKQLIADPALQCALLYPGPHALDLTHCTRDEARAFTPPGKELVLFIIDGTWAHARSMINRSANLRALPQIRFTPSSPSGYGFRRQPHDYCFSTLEAAHWIIERFASLGLSERLPGDPHHGLIENFQAMVTQQIKYAKSHNLRRTVGMRKSTPPPL
jgi:DTW domain-containing protein YfiP